MYIKALSSVQFLVSFLVFLILGLQTQGCKPSTCANGSNVPHVVDIWMQTFPLTLKGKIPM